MIQLVKHKEYRRVSTVYIPMYHEVVSRTDRWSAEERSNNRIILWNDILNCHKLHLAISPPILQRFSWSQWLPEALEKTF